MGVFQGNVVESAFAKLMRTSYIIVLLSLSVLAGCGNDRQPIEDTADQAIESSPQQLIQAARRALQVGNLAAAGQQIQQALLADPGDPIALELAGDIAASGQETATAIDLYQRAIEQSAGPRGEKPSKELLDKLGQQWMNAGRPFESVDLLLRAIEHYPNDPGFRQRIIGLQASLGLEAQCAEHLRWLVQRRLGSLGMLVILSDLSRPQSVEATCQYALENYPDDLRPQYSLARVPAYHSKWSEVAKQLKPVVERHPAFVPALALYGRALVELGDKTAVAKWSQTLPPEIESDQQYWLAAGIWAEQNGESQQAAHAFWRSALLNENEGEALNRFAAALAQIGRVEESQAVAKRAAKVNALRASVDGLISWKNNSQSSAVEIARFLDDLGRRWEATAWLQEAYRMTQNKAPEIDTVYQSIRGKLTGETPWQLPERLVAAPLDLSQLASVSWRGKESGSSGDSPSDAIAKRQETIRFTDQAQALGLNHICLSGGPLGDRSGLPIYESNSGGAAVLDMDLDGWPDAYLSSVDGKPFQSDSRPNGMFRNHQGRFADVTVNARLGDRRYTQGISVGDFNADGFPDLFVANIGRNGLYRNNGDGTFTEVARQAGLAGEAWTSSAAIADLDCDGHADLFELGYCSNDETFERECMDKVVNEPRSCSPLAFPAQADRVWRGNGDGTFTEATRDWLGEHELGRGLGIVVGQLDPTEGLDLYIANDMTANHFWSLDGEAETYRLAEQASLRGLAFDKRSLSQASMGIAAGDPDNDGDIDFLLTHFSDDHNTYYEQIGSGMWADRSSEVALSAPSIRMLGYGTQWVDSDNDGNWELLIANGDIDDFRHNDRLFRQPFQLFSRGPDARWVELSRELIGDYFRRDRLARAIALCDANRDGKTDFLVTHLFEPVGLLINESTTDAHSIRFFVVGTQSHRDAIGTQVSFNVGSAKRTGQLLSGDGFQCSNQRCITFGLGSSAQVEDATVEWPDGTRDVIGTLKSGTDYLLIQGAGVAHALPR